MGAMIESLWGFILSHLTIPKTYLLNIVNKINMVIRFDSYCLFSNDLIKQSPLSYK